jgi:hypothetical protein
MLITWAIDDACETDDSSAAVGGGGGALDRWVALCWWVAFTFDVLI